MEHRNETSEILRNGFLCPSFHRKTNTSSLSLSLSTLSLIPEKIMCFISYEIFKVNWVLDLNLQQYDFFCKIQSNFDKIYCLNLNSQIPFKISLRLLLLVETSKLHGFSLKKKTLIKDTTSNISLFSNPIGFYWIWHHIPTYFLSLYFSKSCITKKP